MNNEDIRGKTLLNKAIEILKDQNYASFRCLCRRLHDQVGDFNETEFYRVLQQECAAATSSIGEVDEENARIALLQPKVFYSKTWAQTADWPQNLLISQRQNVGYKIGNDLYSRILENGWGSVTQDQTNYFNITYCLNNVLNENFLGGIVAGGEQITEQEECWRDFCQAYASLNISLPKTDNEIRRSILDEYTTSLANRYLNERFTEDVTDVDTNGILVHKNRRITKFMLRKLLRSRIEQRRQIRSNDKTVENSLNTVITQFIQELERYGL